MSCIPFSWFYVLSCASRFWWLLLVAAVFTPFLSLFLVHCLSFLVLPKRKWAKRQAAKERAQWISAGRRAKLRPKKMDSE